MQDMDLIQERYDEIADPLHSCTAIKLLVSIEPQTRNLIQTSSDLSICTLPTTAVYYMDNAVKLEANRKSEPPLQGKIKDTYRLYYYSLLCIHTNRHMTK